MKLGIYCLSNAANIGLFTFSVAFFLYRWPMWLQSMLQKSLTSLKCQKKINNNALWGLKVTLTSLSSLSEFSICISKSWTLSASLFPSLCLSWHIITLQHQCLYFYLQLVFILLRSKPAIDRVDAILVIWR